MKRRYLFHRLARWLSDARTSYLLDRSLGWGRWEALSRAIRGEDQPCYPPNKGRQQAS